MQSSGEFRRENAELYAQASLRGAKRRPRPPKRLREGGSVTSADAVASLAMTECAV